ncbi:RluA family pseudouridine synthase [Sphingoaurantiacus capsulatus]|uniref:RluA family pseudouridine synthase n=1 Tax=Sphingoaurantiacus capsulatus TaxID=1771310 RepID=A0ABV7X9N0_9SPHN
MLGDRTLHIDAHLVILDKPAGLAVHPGPQTPRSLEDHLDELRFGFQRQPQPAHRLDRDTSGCLVLGRHPKATKRLGALFEAGAVSKVYWAVLSGIPDDEEGEIDAPLLKVSTQADGWRIVVDPKGKPAQTAWQLLDRREGKALVEFRPKTGRTHQIRVHAAHLGHPIVGDPVYGKGAGLLLHARSLTIPYREDGPPVEAKAPMPPTMKRFGFDI